MCEAVLDEQVLALIRETPGVIDFVRGGSAPVPLSPQEAERLVAGQEGDTVKIIPLAFDSGDRVRIIRGAFAQMEGEVASVLPNSGKFRVRLTILGRPATLDLEAFEILQIT